MPEVRILPLGPDHVDSVDAFFQRLPNGDRTFFKEPVEGRGTVEGWVHDERGERHLAMDGDRVVGYVAVVPGVGWSEHVGELRLVVDAQERGRGLGRKLARFAVRRALERDLAKLVVEVVADQTATIRLFQGLGFVPEALLEDHVRDGAGRVMDLIVLAHRGRDSWEVLTTVGLDGELA